MSYRVLLKPRTENRRGYGVPKRCSSCNGKPAPERRMLRAEHRTRKGDRIRWAVQLPLCQTCRAMADVLQSYRPSRHGPPDRAAGNRWAALGLLVLSLTAIIVLWVPAALFTDWTGLPRYGGFGILAILFAGLYLWNHRANRRARLVAYRRLVSDAQFEFGDVRVENGVSGPALVFENEEYGRAFAESNREHTAVDGDDEANEGDPIPPTSAARRIVRTLMNAFRIR